MYSIDNSEHMSQLKNRLISNFPVLKNANVSGGITDGEVSFPGLEIPHYRSVLTSALQKSVRRQMPNQMEKAIVLLLFIISCNPNTRDRKAITTLLKKRLLVTAVEDAFCYIQGIDDIHDSWGDEGVIDYDKLIKASRNLCQNGTCRFAHDKKYDKGHPVVIASNHSKESRKWKSLNPTVFNDIMHPKKTDNNSVLAIQNCIKRMYKGKSQRIKNNKTVGDFTMLLLAIWLYRLNLSFMKDYSSDEIAKDNCINLAKLFENPVYDEHSGICLVKYHGCGDVTKNKFRLVL